MGVINLHNIELLESREGVNSVKVDGFLLHSKYAPLSEATKLAQQIYKEKHKHIIFGAGLGYIVNELIQLFQHNEIIYVLDSIFPALENNYANLICIEDLSEATIASFLYNNLEIGDKFTVYCSPNYDKVLKKAYELFLEQLNEHLTFNQVTSNTILYYAENWQKNYMYNLKNLNRDFSIANLENTISLPIIVAAGGPSLTKQLSLVRDNRENLFVICAGSTINSLLNANIMPDLVISVDGGEMNYHHFANLNLSNCKLVYSVNNHYKIREQFETSAYYFIEGGTEYIQRHIKDNFDLEVPMIEGASSVAAYAISIANYIGKDTPVALIGQDLAYTNNQTHASSNKGMLSLEEVAKRRNLVQVKGYNNEVVYTEEPWLVIKRGIEELVYKLSKTLLYNCTEGGVIIRNMQPLAFKEFIEKFVAESNNEHHIQHIEAPLSTDQLRSGLEKNLKKVAIVEFAVNNNLQLLKVAEMKGIFSNKALAKMEENDRLMNDILNAIGMTFLIEKLNLDLLNKFPKNEVYSTCEIFEKNIFFYSEIATALEKLKGYIQNILNEL